MYTYSVYFIVLLRFPRAVVHVVRGLECARGDCECVWRGAHPHRARTSALCAPLPPRRRLPATKAEGGGRWRDAEAVDAGGSGSWKRVGVSLAAALHETLE